MNVRTQTTYFGRVQGVGFRWRVCQAVKPFKVTGYVLNKSDGSVETLLEGEAEVVKGALALLESQLKEFWRSKKTEQREGKPTLMTFQLSVEEPWQRLRLMRAIAVPYCW